MKCKTSICSFPHGNFILLPFLVVTVASVMSFGSLASCDLVKTEWAIDCSSSQNTSNCVYIATMKMGLIVKETFVEGELDENNSPEMLKMCTFYTDQERHWLLDRSFSVSFVINACTMIFGFMSMFVLLMSSTRPLKVDAFRTMSVGFGINAILNMSPLLILLKSNVCTDGGICDDSQTNCVSGCELSTGSWQVLATSVMWISAMISSWVISPAQIDLDGRPHGHDKTKGAKDEESQKTVSCSRSSSFESGRSKEDDEENS